MDRLGLKTEMRDLMRGISGGLIFGLPVLYTMEVWFRSGMISSLSLAAIFFVALILNVLFSYFAGLRLRHTDLKFFNAIMDGVTSMGIGLALSAAILYLTGLLDVNKSFQSSFALVVLEASIMSLGITFTNFKFPQKETETRSLVEKIPFLATPDKNQLRQDLNDFVAAAAGAFIYSFNTAPTEEIIFISSGLSAFDLILLFFAELLLCFVVLFASGLKRYESSKKLNFFQKPFNEVIMTWSVSFMISSLMILVFGFGDISFEDGNFLATSLVLTLPAVIGGSAGRLAV